MSETRKLAAILVADVVGYSRLAGADEDRTLARLRGLRSDLIDPAIAAHHGRIVNRTGDGSIIEFRSVVDAVRCAIEVQNGLIERNAGVPEDRQIQFRVGIHVGDVVEEADGDLMGDGVNIAARLESVAKAGTICLSEQAYWQVKGRLDLRVTDLGATQLKNITEPIRVYSVEVGKPGAPRKPVAVARGRLFPALAALAAILAIAVAGAWFWIAGKPSATAPPAATAAASAFGPAAAILPFANATGDARNDALALRLGQKAADYLGKYTWLRTMGRSSGAAKAAADPIAAARELGADYAVTAEVDSGADSPRATFHVDDVHSGARVWSQTLAPILEDPKVRRGRGRTCRARGIADARRDLQRRADAGEGQKGRGANHLRLCRPGLRGLGLSRYDGAGARLSRGRGGTRPLKRQRLEGLVVCRRASEVLGLGIAA
jgi:class 3 adenylate cyclase/TolB-like protein